MRKKIIQQHTPVTPSDEQKWLDLAVNAQVELSSEDASYPIESALNESSGPGWRAAESGKQSIRILFDAPQRVCHIHLQFRDNTGGERTQEFTLSSASVGSQNNKEIVRQQYNFNADSTVEIENYRVELDQVTALELVIIPDKNGGTTRASLARLRVA